MRTMFLAITAFLNEYCKTGKLTDKFIYVFMLRFFGAFILFSLFRTA